MNDQRWTLSPPDVAYFRDAAGTWVAAEVVHASRFSRDLLEPLDPEQADLRIAFLDAVPPSGSGPDVPGWLVLLPAVIELEPPHVATAILDAWPHSPSFRPPGETPEAYIAAGFRALCPPHPSCEVGPGARDSLMEYLAERPGILGKLAMDSRDGVNRLLRVFWPTPEAFAEEILRERIRDEGGRHLLRLVTFLEAATVASEAAGLAPLENARRSLLERLAPLRYFMDSADYDRAAALALEWREQYQRAYEAHYRAVQHAAHGVQMETEAAERLLPELRRLNAPGRPVGAEAARRLEAALRSIRALPEGVDFSSPQTAGVMLGRLPTDLGEARLAAAAVMAAIDVHRRRGRGAHRGVSVAPDHVR